MPLGKATRIEGESIEYTIKWKNLKKKTRKVTTKKGEGSLKLNFFINENILMILKMDRISENKFTNALCMYVYKKN